MDHNSPNQNINTSPATLPTPPLSPSLPPPSPQLQPRPQEESHLEFSRGIRILIWFICNIVFGALPIGAIAIYWQVHSQVSTFPALLIKGDLIAISVAILAEALGHTFLRTLAKPKSLLVFNILRFFAILLAIAVAIIVLTSFIAIADCYELHPQDASKVCNFLVISDANILLWSLVIYVNHGCQVGTIPA